MFLQKRTQLKTDAVEFIDENGGDRASGSANGPIRIQGSKTLEQSSHRRRRFCRPDSSTRSARFARNTFTEPENGSDFISSRTSRGQALCAFAEVERLGRHHHPHSACQADHAPAFAADHRRDRPSAPDVDHTRYGPCARGPQRSGRASAPGPSREIIWSALSMASRRAAARSPVPPP